MQALTKRLSRQLSAISRAAAQQSCQIEPLEGRRLLSATWGTISAYNGADIHKLVASPSGNLYAVGSYFTTSWNRGIALEMIAGSNTWTPILDLGVSTASTDFTAVAADALGNVYVAGRNGATTHQTIWERKTGQSNFVVIDDFAT